MIEKNTITGAVDNREGSPSRSHRKAPAGIFLIVTIGFPVGRYLLFGRGFVKMSTQRVNELRLVMVYESLAELICLSHSLFALLLFTQQLFS